MNTLWEGAALKKKNRFGSTKQSFTCLGIASEVYFHFMAVKQLLILKQIEYEYENNAPSSTTNTLLLRF